MDIHANLAEVDAAISKILVSGQNVKIGGQEVTRADLKTLYAMKKELESTASSSGGMLGRCGTAVFDRR